MNTKIDEKQHETPAPISTESQTKKNLDVFFWTLIALLLVVGIVVNHVFVDLATTLRLAGWIVLSCIVILLVYRTSQGQRLWKFASNARMEMRKVVWPTRQETTHMTMIIAALVVVVALLLWAIDAFLLWGISWLNS